MTFTTSIAAEAAFVAAEAARDAVKGTAPGDQRQPARRRQHEPKPGTFYNGGTFAKCLHCGATILWASVGDAPTAWRGGRSSTTSTTCERG